MMHTASLMGNSMLIHALRAHINCTTGQHPESSSIDAMKEKWNAILASSTTLPTEYIQHYNEDGMPTCKTYFTLTTTATTPEDNLPTVLCLSPPATTSTPVQSCGYIYGTNDSDDDIDETSSSGYLDFASMGK